jgi:hypothetical protein
MELAGLGVVSLLLQSVHLHTKSRIRDRCFVLLRHVQLVLLREPCASVPLTQDLELRPVCCELLRKTPLRLDGARQGGLLVLGVGRLWGSNLSPLVCLVEVVKLEEGCQSRCPGSALTAVVVVFLRWPRRCHQRLTAVRAGVQLAAPCSRSPAEVLRAGA